MIDTSVFTVSSIHCSCPGLPQPPLLWCPSSNDQFSLITYTSFSTRSLPSNTPFNSVQPFCDAMDCSTPGFPVQHQLPKLTKARVHRVRDVIQSSHPIGPLLLPPSVFPSIRVFSNESVLRIRWPKHWSFSFTFSASSENSGLIYLKIHWFDFLAVQGTLKSLLQLQFKSMNSSVPSFLYGPTLTSIHDY